MLSVSRCKRRLCPRASELLQGHGVQGKLAYLAVPSSTFCLQEKILFNPVLRTPSFPPSLAFPPLLPSGLPVLSSSVATPWTVACQVPGALAFSSKNAGVGCHPLLQGILPTGGLKRHLLLGRWVLYRRATCEDCFSPLMFLNQFMIPDFPATP